MRRIAVVTVARSDWGLYLPILRRLREAPDVDLRIIATGTHLSPAHGRTEDVIVADGFRIDRRVEVTLAADSPQSVAKSMALATMGIGEAYADLAPDLLLLLGDRFEMHAAGVAAVPFGFPVAHVHGGEITEGAIDDAFRHSLTKLSHLHFPTTAEHARRIAQMGEEPWRIHAAGAPSLDNVRALRLLDEAALGKRLGIDLSERPLVVTFHPVTLEHESTAAHVEDLLAALSSFDLPVVFTMPNADTRNSVIREGIARHVAAHPRSKAFESLGTVGYFSLLSHARAMVGNSSSGIIEAASFELPVVNVGNRQKGRLRPRNVIDVDCERASIAKAISQAIDPAFREGLRGLVNPYGDGHAAERIVRVLLETPLDSRLRLKRFVDVAR